CGSRKFGLEHLTRDDVVTLTREAAEVTGLRYIMDADKEIAEQILMGKEKPKGKIMVKVKPKVSAKPSAKAKQKPKQKAKR
ncbi:MAG: FMN-binding glutamate synthase family protein, partial [Candidatus Brocadia sp.]|nr:FMN-binding glutamate synthase family protein [Candidatus Brocadia sp.]